MSIPGVEPNELATENTENTETPPLPSDWGCPTHPPYWKPPSGRGRVTKSVVCGVGFRAFRGFRGHWEVRGASNKYPYGGVRSKTEHIQDEKERRGMRAILFAVVAGTVAASGLQSQQIRGEWEADFWNRNDRVHIQMWSDLGRRSMQTGFSLDSRDLIGLDANIVGRDERGDVRFEIRRDAGTTAFEGQVQRGEGWGDFTFTENPDFRRGMADLGYDDLRTRDVFSMALHSVSRQFVRGLQDAGYRGISTSRLLAMGIHGATPEFIREMEGAGYEGLSVDELLQFRIHGVRVEFIDGMRDVGLASLRPSELVQARIHGVRPDYVREMRDRGFRNLSFQDLVQTRIHGVSSDFIADIAALGYNDVPLSQLVQLRIHGVSPSFVRSVRDRGFPNVRLRELVQMKIHGVSASFLDELREWGFDLSIQEAVQFRIHGVSAHFAQAMMELPLGGIDGQNLIQMRIHGVTVDFAEDRLAEFDGINADDLVQMRIHGSRWWGRRRR